MDNVSDWLYIVFLIIAGVSGLFTSGKKKKHPKEILGHPENGVPTNPTQGKGFWEVLQEMQTEKPVSKPKPAQATSPKKQKMATPSPTPFLTGERNISGHRTEIPSLTQREQNDGETGILTEETFTDIAEIRKAIICSEILNRKY